MSHHDIYIAEITENDDFQWDVDNLPPEKWSGNIPNRASPFFVLGPNDWYEIMRQITGEKYQGRQTDWGGFVAIVNKAQIEDLCSKLYEGYEKKYKWAPWLIEQIDELKTYINSLSVDKKYYLVASET